MKQNTPLIYIQISTAQGPAECRIFARFVLGKLFAEAQAKGIDAELVTETADKHGILSATLKLVGQKAESLAQTWQGTLQWICPSPVRPKHPRKNWYIGVFRLLDIKNWRSCYWHKSWQSIMLDRQEILRRNSTRNSIKLSAAIRKGHLSELRLRRNNLSVG